jgi:hypothetical protein
MVERVMWFGYVRMHPGWLPGRGEAAGFVKDG